MLIAKMSPFSHNFATLCYRLSPWDLEEEILITLYIKVTTHSIQSDHNFIVCKSLSECNTILSAYTLHRHLE